MLVALMMLVAVSIGLASAAQGPTNAALGKHVGPLQAAFVSFFVAFIGSTLLLVTLGDGDLSQVFACEPWELMGGLCGAMVVCGTAAAIPHLGAALVLMISMLGQMGCSMVLDSFGLLNTTAIALEPLRVAGFVLFFVGVLLVYRGNVIQAHGSGAKAGRMVGLYVLLTVLVGIACALVQTISVSLRAHVGLHEYMFVHFGVGSVALLALSLITQKGKLSPFAGIKPWKFTGGLYGIYGMLVLTYAVPVLGVALSAAGNMFGQLAGALAINKWGLFGANKIRNNGWRIAGVVLLAVGMLMVMTSRMM